MDPMQQFYFHSPLGNLLVSGTEDYVSQIEFTEQAVPASEDITSAALALCKTELEQYFHGTLKAFMVPVCQEGTDFQQRVWKELQSIPFGKTISYLELSKRIGDVKAIRAVGTANGKNKIEIGRAHV